MSSPVVRPRGRKPAAVYWRRRMVLLVALAFVVFLAVRWVGMSGDQENAAADQSAGRPAPSVTAAKSASTNAPMNAGKDASRKPTTAPPAKQRVTTKLVAPKGECDIADVVVVPDVVDAAAVGAVPVRLGLSTLTDKSCTLELTHRDLALEITSGPDLIWVAKACPDALADQSVTLRRGWVSYIEVSWNGRRATDDCLPTNAFAKPGYYWAEAALIGGEAAEGQFRLKPPAILPAKAVRR